MIADGMKNGEIFRGPPSSSALCSRSMVLNPPMPEPMDTPTAGAVSGVTVSDASSIANCDAAIAYWMKASIFLTSFFSMNCSGSKPRTSPAMRVAAGDERRPVDLGPDPEGRHQPYACDDHPSSIGHALLFGFRVSLDVLDRFL